MTWTILARDAGTGGVGTATAARIFAASAHCLRGEGRVAAGATQASALLDSVRAGAAAEAAVRTVVDANPGCRARQLHVLRADGASFRHTGDGRVEWAGRVDGSKVSVSGNMLVGVGTRLIVAPAGGDAAGGGKADNWSVASVASEDPHPGLDRCGDDHAGVFGRVAAYAAIAWATAGEVAEA